jgi:hypothetical protein
MNKLHKDENCPSGFRVESWAYRTDKTLHQAKKFIDLDNEIICDVMTEEKYLSFDNSRLSDFRELPLEPTGKESWVS